MAQFDQSVYLLEKRDYRSSTDLAQKVTDDISSLIKMLGEDYEHALRTYRFSRLDTIRKKIADIQLDKMDDQMSDYVGMLVELEKYVSYSREEVNRNYPSESLFKVFYKRHKKLVNMGLVMVLMGVLGYSVWVALRKNKVGLVAEYFGKSDLTAIYKRQIDPVIDFKWGRKSPFPRWKRDNFSVRWSGYLLVPKEGEYEFSTQADDGVALWIGENKIISNWSVRRLSTDKASIFLKKGYVPLRLEYFEAGRTAEIHLYWRRPGDKRPSILKSKYLVPTKEQLRSGIPIN